MNLTHNDVTDLINALRQVPKNKRHAHHQMATRYARDAATLLPRNPQKAADKFHDALFHAQFCPAI